MKNAVTGWYLLPPPGYVFVRCFLSSIFFFFFFLLSIRSHIILGLPRVCRARLRDEKSVLGRPILLLFFFLFQGLYPSRVSHMMPKSGLARPLRFSCFHSTNRYPIYHCPCLFIGFCCNTCSFDKSVSGQLTYRAYVH